MARKTPPGKTRKPRAGKRKTSGPKATKRRPRAVRKPAASARPKPRRRSLLQKLDTEQQREVDELVVHIYRLAARELRELEKHQVVELRQSNQELAEAAAKARAELMRTLKRWEESKDG